MESKEPQKHGTRAIQMAELDPIPFAPREPKTLIYFTCPEGTSLCPRSGFPDFWTLHLWYVPGEFIVELKSLKLYLNRYREASIYHEELPHLILRDFKERLQPSYMKIVLDYTRRGNIQTDVMLEFKTPGYVGPEAPTWAIRYGLR